LSDELPFDYRSCREAFRRLDDYLDRELTPGEMEAVRRHLEVCAMCADEFRVEAEILRGLKAKVARAGVPPEVERRVWAAVNAARRGHAGPQGSGSG